MGQYDKNYQSYLMGRLRAAEKGQAEAYYDLGLLYSTGQGVDLDMIAAHKWFNLAAMKGVKRAQVDRADLAGDMSAWEVAEAQKMAREWQSNHH